MFISFSFIHAFRGKFGIKRHSVRYGKLLFPKTTFDLCTSCVPVPQVMNENETIKRNVVCEWEKEFYFNWDASLLYKYTFICLLRTIHKMLFRKHIWSLDH